MNSPVKAKKTDLIEIQELLQSCRLPIEDLSESHIKHFFVVKKSSEIVGVIGLEATSKVGLLRSLAVKKELRNKGIGRTLVQHLENYGQRLGITQLYLLTMDADSFFRRIGYNKVEREQAPRTIQKSEEFSSICPSSAILMVKELEEK